MMWRFVVDLGQDLHVVVARSASGAKNVAFTELQHQFSGSRKAFDTQVMGVRRIGPALDRN